MFESRSAYYDHAMAYYLETALLLEEKAARLPRESERRARLLALAKASRQIGLDEAASKSKLEPSEQQGRR